MEVNTSHSSTRDTNTSLQIQFYPAAEEIKFHVKNEADELQRQNVIDDLCSGLLVQANVADVIHGKDSENGSPSTLLVLTFSFQGISNRRRFRHVEIKIRFADEKQPYSKDPKVVDMWPNGDFTLSETKLSIEETRGLEGVASGGFTGANAGLTAKWERQTTKEVADRAYLSGAKRIEGRNFGQQNAVRLNLSENKSQAAGVVSELRTAILLKRKEDDNRFVAHVEINADVDAQYKVERLMRKISGKSPENDPVVFDAHCQPTRSDIDRNNLGSLTLKSLSDVLSTTILSTVREQKS